MKKIKKVCLVIILNVLLFTSCRKEETNTTTGNAKVYLKNFKVQESGDYADWVPKYDANNKVTNIEVWGNNGPTSNRTLESNYQIIWINSTKLRMQKNSNEYIDFTIPLANLSEERRMPTQAILYENNIATIKWDYEVYTDISYVYKVTRTSLTTNQITYQANSNYNFPNLEIIEKRFIGSSSETIKYKYTLSYTQNKNVLSCRELYWFLLLNQRDVFEDFAMSPYWQNLNIPSSLQSFLLNGSNWVPTTPIMSYPTIMGTGLLNGYITKISYPSPNYNGVFQEWGWVVR